MNANPRERGHLATQASLLFEHLIVVLAILLVPKKAKVRLAPFLLFLFMFEVVYERGWLSAQRTLCMRDAIFFR